ncbi:hypothetical protein FA95DRAFT_1579927 [Auriscalpium vulgare]|uniref:Uncharacterized protein n=1 Tax=Auriscalpium vulgare TaxID=40419 RepID=A0ACB8S9I3_9AGAM|nr:hypothetical protein FA95DRAFT_1579927 [Auriscalpium vulgare]
MLVMLLATLVAAFVVLCLRIPSVWLAFMAIDEPADAHELGMALVATRNPFRESGPPACMAKLIMMRHKLHQTNSRKRRASPSVRQAPRVYALPSSRQRPAPWIRLPKTFGKQFH